MISRFIKYYIPHKRLFIWDMVFAFTVALCDLFYPMITRNIINIYIPNKQLNFLFIWTGALLVIYFFKMLLNHFILFQGHMVGVGIQADMRKEMFKKIQKLPFTYFDNNKTGTLMSKVINDLMDMSELAHHGPEDLFISIVMLVGSFIALSFINISLTLILFAFIPILVIFAIRKRKRMQDAFAKARVDIGEVNASIENSISGVRVTKAFCNSEIEFEKFQKSNECFVDARRKSYKVMAEFHAGMNAIIDVLNLVVLILGGVYTYFNIITIGDFTAFILYVGMFVNPIKKLIGFVEQYQSGMSGFARFVELVDEVPEHQCENAKDLIISNGEITFKDVSFAYNDQTTVLDKFNLKIKEHNTVALVGPSGGGKTTICNLIPRFYQIDSGVIKIDGQDITSLTFESLRKNIGIVSQDVFLFNGTIFENLAYGDLEASYEQVIQSAKQASIHDYITSLPQGYDTNVGERGVKLSGGQKQRISIARVFLKNPPILILDEATSALDNATESLIQKSLEELTKDRTTIVVAHRLSTIKNADEIIVFADKGVCQRGTHEQLMEQDGIYKEFYFMGKA